MTIICFQWDQINSQLKMSRYNERILVFWIDIKKCYKGVYFLLEIDLHQYVFYIYMVTLDAE